jgi:hypothetical protein
MNSYWRYRLEHIANWMWSRHWVKNMTFCTKYHTVAKFQITLKYRIAFENSSSLCIYPHKYKTYTFVEFPDHVSIGYS